MSSTVQHLIPESQAPETLVTVTEEMSVQDALERMIEYDFSQLPVVDSEFKLKGLITSDSLLRAASYFKSTLDEIKVSHAIVKVKPCRPNDDLSELLNGLRDASAIPVVDKAGKLMAIVTNYDTAEYYRQRAEDIMLAEDIETTLRDYIESAYRDSNGDIDQEALQKAIEEITPSGKEFKNKFRQALHNYLGRLDDSRLYINQILIDEVYEKYLGQPSQAKKFEDLTLFEYIQLFKNLWEKYKVGFNHLEWDLLDKLLNEVRQTRNAIAHFRTVTSNQQKQLQFCANLLDRHRSILEQAIVSDESASISIGDIQIHSTNPEAAQQTNVETEVGFDPTNEEINPNDSRYAPLAIYLQSQVQSEHHKIQLTFEQIEEIIRDQLPPSARKHRTWWTNDAVSHAQSQQWLEAGWRVSSVNISEERVVFTYIGEQQSAYIDFFNALLSQLRTASGFSVEPTINPEGRPWLTVKIMSNEVIEPIKLGFSFTPKSQFRIELYIDTHVHARNKQIFDKLHEQKIEIEEQFGASLDWERLDGKQGSRIATYRNNSSIKSSPEELTDLQNWACETMIRFYKAIAGKARYAFDERARYAFEKPFHR